jgi:hypothetical protein
MTHHAAHWAQNHQVDACKFHHFMARPFMDDQAHVIALALDLSLLGSYLSIGFHINLCSPLLLKDILS